MAGNLPVPNGVELKLVWTRSGVPVALNILHGTHNPGVTHTQARANTIDSNIKTFLTSSGHGGNLHTTIALQAVHSRHMDSNSDPWFIGANAPVAGTGTGDLLPLANCFVVTARTGLRGRSYNGRVYLMGYSEAVNDATGQIIAADAAESVAFLNGIHNEIFNTTQILTGVLSRWTTPPGSAPGTPAIERNPPIITTTTTYVNLDLRWDVQRRRNNPGV